MKDITFRYISYIIILLPYYNTTDIYNIQDAKNEFGHCDSQDQEPFLLENYDNRSKIFIDV